MASEELTAVMRPVEGAVVMGDEAMVRVETVVEMPIMKATKVAVERDE